MFPVYSELQHCNNQDTDWLEEIKSNFRVRQELLKKLNDIQAKYPSKKYRSRVYFPEFHELWDSGNLTVLSIIIDELNLYLTENIGYNN